MSENEEEIPQLHTGTINGVSCSMTGLQTLSFTDHMTVFVENYGVRQLYSACELLGQPNPVGMRIEFAMDDMIGTIMETFQIIGNNTHIACYKCQKIIDRKDKSEYTTCEECGHIYCRPCKEELGCPFCALKEQIKNE